MRDLIAREHPRKPLALPRTPQLRGWIVRDRTFAAQVSVEGVQARDLAPDRGRRRGRARGDAVGPLSGRPSARELG